MTFSMRHYQTEFHNGAIANLSNGSTATLGVMATGLGKTVSSAWIAEHFHATKCCRTLFLAHREELIHQAARTYAAVHGSTPDIEMGQMRADQRGWYGKNPHVIASIQTLCREKRHSAFRPDEFGLIVWDEAHHACPNRNKSYNKIFEHFRQNDNIKHLGITATPDRADEEALGGMFDSVIKFQRDGKEFEEYGILQGIHDGWLVEIDQEFVEVECLDVSKVRKSGGDLNEGDLAAIMDEDKILHRILAPAYEAAAGRPCIIFMPPRRRGDHGQSPSEKAADILNGYRPECARFLSGNPHEVTPEQRDRILKQFRGGEIQFLVNCAIAIEGFDAPSTAVIVMARLTTSRSFYAQCIGRATRPLRDIVPALNAEPDPGQRKAMIANSPKPRMLVLDFCGNSGKHKLISSADVLGGNYSDDVVDRAKKNAKAKGCSRTEDELKAAEEELRVEQKRRRQQYIAKATYSRTRVDPFAYSDVVPTREPGWHRGRKPSDKQIAMLSGAGIDKAESMSFWEASQMIGEVIRWRAEGLATYKQRKLISKFGYDPNMKFTEASAIITNLKNNGWQRKDW